MTRAEGLREINAWFVKRLDGQTFKRSDLVDEATQHFRKRRFGDLMLRDAIQEVVHKLLNSSRHGLFNVQDDDAGGGLRPSRWETFLERAAEGNVKLLMDMDRTELAFAIDCRWGQVQPELRTIGILQHLKAKLQENEKVRDRFTVEQIQSIDQRIAVDVNFNLSDGDDDGHLRRREPVRKVQVHASVP